MTFIMFKISLAAIERTLPDVLRTVALLGSHLFLT